MALKEACGVEIYTFLSLMLCPPSFEANLDKLRTRLSTYHAS